MAGRKTTGVSKDAGQSIDDAYAQVEQTLLGRWPEHRIDPTLDRIAALVSVLGDPHRAAPVIHLTGTNGKSTTARMIDALLHTFALRTGRFVSPHVESVRERISLDNEPISKERFVEVFREIEPYIALVDERNENPLSFFEIITGMAFATFADAPVDVAVMEVGLGGTWDSTNVADGRVAVITPIALDHTRYLGSTPAEIASDKSGIIKPNAVVVLAQQEVEVAEVMHARAAEVGATMAREGLEFGVTERNIAVGGQLVSIQGLSATYEDLFIPLHGEHQARNAACALAAVESFLAGGLAGHGLDVDVVREAFASVRSPARLEVVRRGPTIIVDSAHNPHGARATVAAIDEAFTLDPLVGVVGIMRDKDAYEILEVIEPILTHIVCTRNSTDRAMPAAELGELAAEIFGPERVTIKPRLDDAIDTAVGLVEAEATELGGGGVLITGSVVTAGQARGLLGGGREAGRA